MAATPPRFQFSLPATAVVDASVVDAVEESAAPGPKKTDQTKNADRNVAPSVVPQEDLGAAAALIHIQMPTTTPEPQRKIENTVAIEEQPVMVATKTRLEPVKTPRTQRSRRQRPQKRYLLGELFGYGSKR